MCIPEVHLEKWSIRISNSIHFMEIKEDMLVYHLFYFMIKPPLGLERLKQNQV